MRKPLSALLAAASCILLTGCITAEQRHAWSEKLVASREQGKAVALLGAQVDSCSDITVGLARVVAPGQPPKKFDYRFRVQPDPLILDEGEYVVTSVTCRLAQSRSTLVGPYARFGVKSGEVINLGFLKLQQKFDNIFLMGGTVRKSVQPLPEHVLSFARQHYPEIMAKMTDRPMVLLGSEEGRFRRRGLLF